VLWNIIYIIQFLVHPVGGNMSENKETKSHKALAYRLHTYSLAVQPSESLGLLNYRRLIFPVDCLLSPSLNLHLPQILLYSFQPSHSRSSPSSTYFQFTLKYFLNCTFPDLFLLYVQSFLFNICYYV